MKSKFYGATYAVFTAVVVGFFVFCFYYTPLGVQVEHKLFDIRIRVKPDVVPTGGVTVVTITPETLINLGQKKNEVSLSLENVQKIVAHATGFKSINILFTKDVYELSDSEKAFFLALAKKHPRVRYGVFNVDSPFPSSAKGVPPYFKPVENQIFGVDTFKLRTTDIVREIPLFAYREGQVVNMLPAEMAGVVPGSLPGPLYLNYIGPKRLNKIDAFTFLNRVPSQNGEHLFLGYGYLDVKKDDSQFAYANTPWQEQGDALNQGMYVVDLIAISALNFLHHTYLRISPDWAVVAQTVAVSTIFAVVWVLGSSWAFALIVGTAFALIYAHGALFSYYGFYIPLGDTALIAILAGIIGGQWRLKVETQLRIAQEADTLAQKEFAKAQT